MKKEILSILLSLLLLSTAGFSQAPSGAGRPDPANMPLDAKVTGIIIDASTNQPVEYASVAIYRTKDSTLIGGVVTDPAGKFAINNLPYGKFYAVISFIGYKKSRVENILLIPNQKTKDLGSVKLDASSTALKEVEVVGNKSAMEYRIDKKVVDVSQNVTASGGTLADALQNTPSVQTDVEGNVSLRGSSNFTVLIDGKPSVIQGSEALQQIPASIVQNVEIITNPSAKYDAEGSAGIINVIMKKQKIRGTNGVINLTAGTGDKYRGDININYRVSKFNFSVGADFNDMGFKMTQFQNNINPYSSSTYNQPTTRDQIVNGTGKMSRNGYGFKGGIDYTINDKSSVTVGANIGNRSFNRSFSSQYEDQFLNSTTGNSINSVLYDNMNTGKVKRDYYSANLDYQLKFNDKGHQLSATAFISGGPDDNIGDLYQDTTNSGWLPLDTKIYHQHTAQNSNEKEFRTKVDYTFPFSEKGKFEAGYQGRYTTHNGEYHSQINDVEDMNQYDKLTFKQNIQSGYLILSNSMPLFDYQLGLRAEYEKRNLEQNITSENVKVNRIDFFPTIHASKQLPWNLQLQASYTRRINRPNEWNLNPLKMYMNPQEVRTGNPGLLPEFTNSYELNLQKKLNEGSFVSMEGFVRQTYNLIQQVVNTDVQTGITTNSFANFNHDQSAGAEFMLNLTLAKWFTFNASSSVFNYQIFGNEQYGVSNNTTTWNLRANPAFRLSKGTSIQINAMYNAPTITAQGTRSDFYTTGIGIRQSILKNKASITLNVRDILGQVKMTSTTNGTNLYKYNWMKREAQVIMVTLSYRINNYKQQAKRTQEDANTGEQGGEMGM